MSAISLTRRTERFARALEGDVPGGGLDAGLDRLVRVAAQLRDAGRVAPAAPSPVFREVLRGRLLAVSAVSPGWQPVPSQAGTASPTRRAGHRSASVGRTSARRPLAMAVATASLAAVVGGAGVAVAASRSLPGSPWYALKRAAEALQLDFTLGNPARGRLELEFARTRLAELQQLVHDHGTIGEMTGTLHDMNAEMLAGRRDLVDAYRQTHAASLLRTLTDFAQAQDSGLVRLLPALPPRARASAVHAVAVVLALDRTAFSLCGAGCGADLGRQLASMPGRSSRTGSARAGGAGRTGSTPATGGSGPAAGTGASSTASPNPASSPTPSATTPAGAGPHVSPSLPLPSPSLPLPSPSLPLPSPSLPAVTVSLPT